MDNNSIEENDKTIATLSDIEFSEHDKRPLGGINPYSPSFDIIGTQFCNSLEKYVSLNNNIKILDLGCGTGRFIKAIAGKHPKIRCDGFDINSKYIDYCKKTYDSEFMHCDYYHEEYNKNGSSEYFVPFKAKRYDIVVILGVFNHNRFNDVQKIIDEGIRVLRPRGIMMFTSLLLNEFSINEIDNGKTNKPFKFEYKSGHERYEDQHRACLNIAHSEIEIRRYMIANKLIIKEPIKYGAWCNYKDHLMGHDIVIARKGGWGR